MSILRLEIAYQDDLLIHDGLLNRAPKVTTTQIDGRIRQKRRYYGGQEYLWKLEDEEGKIESQKAQEEARK